ncbi:MAG: DUF2779 domain-containing protein [Chitinophagales bacterium]
MQLTKTNYIQFLNCPESLWLLKNKPSEYPAGEFSLFLQKLVKEGYEVEEYAQKLFPHGTLLPSNVTTEATDKEINKGNGVFFQPSFETNEEVYARIDVLEKLKDGTWHIYEIKSSTRIKTDKKHNHLKDACFQKYVLTECGYNISKVSIIHLNKDYCRNGSIVPNDLLKIVDVTEDVNRLYQSVSSEIINASNFIKKDLYDLDSCSCRFNTRVNHCDCFDYFNKDVPPHSIYEINRITAKKIKSLVDNDQLSILDIPQNFELNDSQKKQVASNVQEAPIIDKVRIEKILSDLKFPLHFIDYETYPTAVPLLDDMKPHQHLPFQVSIHTLNKDGDLTHFEYLSEELVKPEKMLSEMEAFTKSEGTFISWHASFEISRNKDMIEWHNEFSSYLTYMNGNMFDLETIFIKEYIDYRFKGRSSIKKVLPVLCPQFSYGTLKIQDGTMALDTWGRMIMDKEFSYNKETTRENLLEYCKLDTLAMVEIYKNLIELTN